MSRVSHEILKKALEDGVEMRLLSYRTGPRAPVLPYAAPDSLQGGFSAVACHLVGSLARNRCNPTLVLPG
jgi:hypothetical protein